MDTQDRLQERLDGLRLSRRQVLKTGLVAGGAAFLAACGGRNAEPRPGNGRPDRCSGNRCSGNRRTRDRSADGRARNSSPNLGTDRGPGNPAPTVAPSPSPSAENFSGVTINVWTTATPATLVANAQAIWEPKTGGKVNITKLDFGDFPIKVAGIISTADSSVDVLYTYAGFMGEFGGRVYDDMGPLVPDTSAVAPVDDRDHEPGRCPAGPPRPLRDRDLHLQQADVQGRRRGSREHPDDVG